MLTPEQIAKAGSEHAHQCALFQWVALEGLRKFPQLSLLFAIPNGGDRRPSVGAAMRAEGVKPGVPDLFLPVPRIVGGGVGSNGMIEPVEQHGLFIEMKKPGRERERFGGRSESQEIWKGKLEKNGYAYQTCFSWLEAKEVLMAYLCGVADLSLRASSVGKETGRFILVNGGKGGNVVPFGTGGK